MKGTNKNCAPAAAETDAYERDAAMCNAGLDRSICEFVCSHSRTRSEFFFVSQESSVWVGLDITYKYKEGSNLNGARRKYL